MKQTKRKGFTIVELVIVIAVIAILAAVLIPTFASVIKKANQSADIQAVRQMNTALAIDGAVTPTSFADFFTVLGEAGFSAENYTPLYSNRCFYWVKSLNKVIYYDKESRKVLYPEGIDQQSNWTTEGWYILDGSYDVGDVKIELGTSQKINDVSTWTYEVSSTEEFVATAQFLNEELKSTSNIANYHTVEIVLKSDINLQGADVCFQEKGDARNIVIKSDCDTVRTITGLYISSNHTHSGHDENGATSSDYGHSLFHTVKSLTVENIKIVDSSVGGYDASQAGFFAGQCYNSGTTNSFKNVTIENCAVQGQEKCGILVGYFTMGGGTTFDNVTINNCTVSTLQGEAGVAFGVYSNLNKIELNKCPFTFENNGLTITNSTVSVYSNEVLTATSGGKTYNVVKFDKDGETVYEMATAPIGFIGEHQNPETHDLEINGTTISGVNIKLYDSITEVSQLEEVKGTKSN